MYMDDEGRIVGLEGGGAAGISLAVFLRSCCCCYLCITHLNELQLTFCTDRLGPCFKCLIRLRIVNRVEKDISSAEERGLQGKRPSVLENIKRAGHVDLN